ncbi:MAG: lytic transglycosylase domain-containing protein [Gemmatimonadota bacterium]|nr:lytic transglycosylase domain-containing protein [Gemmatimonadota bacterium]
MDELFGYVSGIMARGAAIGRDPRARRTAAIGLAVATSIAAGNGIGQLTAAGQQRAVAIVAAADSASWRGVPEDSVTDEQRARQYVSSWRLDLRRTPIRLLDAWLARPEAWRDELVPILEAHSVPPEFLYLALLESGMDPAAESPAAAVGLWQFTEPTARQYGLVVEDGVDERLDWRRSTWAAGRYLRDLYDLFGTWELAAAAYNGGPGRVSRALETTGLDSYWALVEAGHLPRETSDYVPKFLAIVDLAEERILQ